jgi:hypothetical protein
VSRESVVLDALSPEVKLMAMRALAALRVWDRKFGLMWDGTDSGGVTTGDLAAFLHITPKTPERESLNLALTALRKARLIKYEFQRGVDSETHWWLLPQGREVAERLPIGRLGGRRLVSVR